MMTLFRRSSALVLLCLIAVTMTPLAQAQNEATYRFDLPEQPLADALRAIARQTGANVLFESKNLGEIKAPALRAQLTLAQAIERVIAGTTLKAQRPTSTTVVIQPSRAEIPLSGSGQRGNDEQTFRLQKTDMEETPGSGIRLAQAPTTPAGEDSAPDAGPSSASAAEGDVLRAPEIIVTGSRIARKGDYISNSPMVTVSPAQLAASGSPTVEAALNRLPQFVPSETATTNNFGDGVATANLRGLQPNRTLVLLDGRRLIPSGGASQVDLNLIPSNLVQRIEVVTGGASSTYGSDAVAGVVNFILRGDFSGIEMASRYGFSERGDAASLDASVMLGGNFSDDRGNAVISFSYVDREPVFKSERDFSAETGASGTLPQGSVDAVGTNLATQAAVDSVFSTYGSGAGSVARTSGLSFNDDGTLYFRGVNYRGPTTGAYTNIPTRGTFNSTADTHLIVPMERYNAFGRLAFDVSPTTQIFGQFNFTTYEGNPLLGGAPAAGNPASGGNGFLVPVTNPFIPADLQTILASRPNPAAPILIRKRFNDVGGRGRINDYSVHQIMLGARGTLWGDWTWDFAGSRGEVERTETLTTSVSHRAVRTLLEAADGGASLCEGGYNPFGENGISQDCRNFVRRRSTAAFDNGQYIGEASFQGTLLSLPAGDLKVAFGASHRQESFSRLPDGTSMERDTVVDPDNPALNQDSPLLVSGQEFNVVSGSTKTQEFFAETSVPLLRGLPAVDELTLDLGARLSDYDTVGTVNTYKVGLDWRVVSSVRLRGGYSLAVRAPNINELFQPVSVGNVQIGRSGTFGSGDPCDVAGAYRRGPDGAAVRTLCIEQGIPVSLVDSYTLLNTFVGQTSGGNPALREETADTYSAGVVWTPDSSRPLLRGLLTSVDYYNITLEDAVGSIGGDRMLINCFNNPNGTPTNPSYFNENFFCSTIRRDPLTGDVVDVNAVNTNLGKIQTSGVDFQIDWRFGLDAIGLDTPGTLNLNLVGTYLQNFDVQPVLGGVTEERAGSVSNTLGSNHPEWKTLMSLGIAKGAWTATASWHRIQAVEDFNAGGRAAPTINYFDANVLWRSEPFEAMAGVINVTDKQPPVYSSQIEANTDPSTYDVLGRRYFLSASVRF